jgi:heparosan-N-sulfate-glucuronate 5-epimerase
MMNSVAQRVKAYGALAARAASMLRGNSYWHVGQGVGRAYAPGKIAGYFNDLTAKTDWTGPVDAQGLPLTSVTDGRAVPFPTMRLQKALGHWDAWEISGRLRQDHLDAFLDLATWVVEAQDDEGGWIVWPLLHIPSMSPYSAMTQGQAISVLLRAAAVNGHGEFEAAARRGLEPLLRPVEHGGTARSTPSGIVLEEHPSSKPSTILNGWIFALFGLQEIVVACGSTQAASALDASLGCLVALLPRFDASYWSYYDLRNSVASPFYHRLHIAQLRSMERTFTSSAPLLRPTRVRFERQLDSLIGRSRAIVAKSRQKLSESPRPMLK